MFTFSLNCQSDDFRRYYDLISEGPAVSIKKRVGHLTREIELNPQRKIS